MKKENIIICALITCLLTIIIVGSIQDNKKAGNSKDNANKYTEKIDELEKEKEELNKQLEEINKKNEVYNNFSKDEEKTKEELLDIIEKAQFEDNGYQYIVDNVMDSFYRYAFTMHSSPYCGEFGSYEAIDDKNILGESPKGRYNESHTFKNKDDINNFFLEFLSENYYNNNVKEYYLEKDNKLYCFAPGKGELVYKPEESDFKIIKVSEKKIEVFAKTISENIGTDQKIDAYATLINENGNWVVDEYKEFY